MKKIFRDLVLRCVSWSGGAWLYRTVLCPRPLVRVLVFHDVQDVAWFRNIVQFLKTEYHVLTPTDFALENFVQEKINILLTFDDGYASWVTKVLPILQEHECQGIFFVNSGLLDCADQDNMRRVFVRDHLKLDTLRETLSWDGLSALCNAGHTIGGHTVSHTQLRVLTGDAVVQEIVSDKIRIEHMLGDTLTVFAYPFGNEDDYTKETQEVVARAGYSMAFSTTPGFVTQQSYAIPRLCIEDRLTPSHLRVWISGAYDVFYNLKRLCVR